MASSANAKSLQSPNVNFNKIIKYPRFNELYNCIIMCQELSQAMGEANCMALEGCTGAGKTTLLRTFESAFGRYETDLGTKIPVFYMETPSPVTVKGMASRMLHELGDPAYDKGALWSMNARLIHFIKSCEVELVILDDIQHLIDDRGRTIIDVSEWIKVLIKETNVPFLIVGQEGQIENILKANDQLSRLFAQRETLRPFSMDSKEDKKAFAIFVQYAVESTGIAWAEGLPHGELMERLHFASRGVIGNLMNLLYTSALIAGKNNSNKITLDILSEAFRSRLEKHVSRSNPFILEANETFKPPKTPLVDLPEGLGRRGNRRKEPRESASDVLTTK